MLATSGIIQSSRPSATLLLDIYSNASAAYSLRKLRSNYSGSAVRVRRSSDNLEQDIGFLSNEFDVISVNNFLSYQNLIKYSEEFDNSFYQKNLVSVTSNAIAAPDSTNTAEKIIANNTNGSHVIYVALNTYLTLNTSIFYAISIYAKAGEYNWLKCNHSDSVNRQVYFNLLNGTIGTNNSDGNATITSEGNGWYRCTVYRKFNQLASNVAWGPTSGDNVDSFSGDNSSGIYLWGSQINSYEIKTYYKTTTSVAGDSCYITKIYDQSGNSLDISQSTLANQPRLVNNGLFEYINNKPVPFYDGSNDCFERSDTGLPTGNATFITYTYENESTIASNQNRSIFHYGAGSTGSSVILFYANNMNSNQVTNGIGASQYGDSFGKSSSLLTKNLQFVTKPSSTGTWYQYINNSNTSSKSMTTNTTLLNTSSAFRVGQFNSSLNGAYISGYINEIIIYPSDQSSNRTGIESNINSYYSIY
jgi:hypothetical protein